MLRWTKSDSALSVKLGKTILDTLKPRGRKVWEKFVNTITSLQTGITYDIGGVPSWNISLGDITNPATSLDEIFYYLQHADHPCLVAIDEFHLFRFATPSDGEYFHFALPPILPECHHHEPASHSKGKVCRICLPTFS